MQHSVDLAKHTDYTSIATCHKESGKVVIDKVEIDKEGVRQCLRR